jgi:GcvH upstream region-like protein
MLDFFRRHQRYFFVVITVVIVISFSFFGTYNSLGSDQWRERIAFKAVDGSDITQLELDEMAVFLGSDNDDKLLFGGAWGPNFLNDGVIRKDFLETGIAEIIINAYANDLTADFQTRLDKERRYVPYVHPQAKFLSVVNAWNYFAPEINAQFDALRQAPNPTDPEAIKARVGLFLAEKKVPAATLKQILKYQQQQYSWLPQDPNLERADLSLFGYHMLEDWFGARFVRLACQFIINSAKIAEAKGYNVSKAEALADLIRNTDISYQQNKNRPNIGVANPTDYLREQLRMMRMDQARAVKIWQQVLLFRRFFHDVGNASLIDTLAFQKFNDFTKEALELEVYRLPTPLRLGSYAALQKFEVYLTTISNRPKEGKALLKLPRTVLNVDEVLKQYPEMVERKYRLEVGEVDKKNLQARIGLKETWAWELDEANWNALQAKLPELGMKPSKTREERLAALDSLDQTSRAKADAFARSSIVDSHPDWLEKALEEAPGKVSIVGLRSRGGHSSFAGLDQNANKQKELISLLDKAALDSKPQEALKQYSADGQMFYRIKVIERAPQQEVLTFEVASKDGTLDQIRERLLEKYYTETREQNPLLYQNPDMSWKQFSKVKDLVAGSYFGNILKAIQDDRQSIGKDKKGSKTTYDEDASFRFYAYMRDIEAQIKKDPEAATKLVKVDREERAKESLAEAKPLQNQWLLEKVSTRVDRSDERPLVDPEDAFMLPIKGWSSVKTAPNGDLVFFQVEKQVAVNEKQLAVADQTQAAHKVLSDDAQRVLTINVLKELKDKHALSLDYLKSTIEEEER